MDILHNSVLTVDLSAVEENFHRLQKQAPDSEIAPVLKGDAYGLGALEIGQRLFSCGAKTFFVAYLAEGIELRRVLTAAKAKIIVLTGQHESLCEEYRKHNLTPVLNNLDQFNAWRNAAQLAGQRLPAVFQLDVGLRRLGFALDDFAVLTNNQNWRDDLTPEFVMAHLPSANERNAEINQKSLCFFRTATADLPDVKKSLASSAGIYLGDEYQFDLVRPGSALVGVNPARGNENPMTPVASLDARIIEIRPVLKGERFGYAGCYMADRDIRVAVIAIGSADGFSAPKTTRKSNALIGGAVAPLIGMAGSDMTFVDVTDIAERKVRIGQSVNLLGDSGSIDTRAAEAGLTVYEYLSKFGRRLTRLYAN